VNALERSSASIGPELNAHYPSAFESSAVVGQHIAQEVGEWTRATRAALATQFPHAAHADALAKWRAQLQSSPIALDDGRVAVQDFLAFCRAAKHPENRAFWNKQFTVREHGTALAQKLADDPAISARLLLQEWQKRMDHARAEWELCEIAARRAALMARLDQLLQLLQQLQERLQALGLDTGLLLDLSKGTLTAQDIGQFERWARYQAQDEGIRKICDLLGKMRQIELSERIERVKTTALVQTVLPDINSREEIIGIRFGRDIEHALPSELALLADPETALLFDLKYVESALMCFDMQGMREVAGQVEIEEDRSVAEADKQGPMVICIDTSGSMQGMPETVAKAVALFLAARARKEKRACYLINFSDTIDTLDLGAEVGMDALLRFLQMSFHGGTDVAPAFDHALRKMEHDTYRNADLLLVSDFVMAGLPGSLLARIERRRLDGNRFHSLVVGETAMRHRLRTHFDNEWVYDPRAGMIHELIAFERKLRGSATLA
jgi:uncharacterized protein with von Willebrand factor type A (vWA) domain